MRAADFAQTGNVGAAAILSAAAEWMKRTVCRRVGGIGRQDSEQQRLRKRVLRALEYLVGRRQFDDLADTHHGDAVADRLRA